MWIHLVCLNHHTNNSHMDTKSNQNYNCDYKLNAVSITLTKYWNISFLATKSVSQLSSIRAALFSFWANASNPSAAVLADFFDARTFPLFLKSF